MENLSHVLCEVKNLLKFKTVKDKSPIKNLWNIMGGQMSYANPSTKPKQGLHTLNARKVKE